MTLVLADRVKETTTSTGTTAVTLLGATTGFQSFSAVGNGNTTFYTISAQSGTEWEVGVGTYTAAGTTLSRDTVLASSNSGSLVNFTAGTKDVFVTYPAERAIYSNTAGTTNYVPKFTSSTAIGNSLIQDNGVANVGINLTPDYGAALQVGQGGGYYGIAVYDSTGLASTNGFTALTHYSSGAFLSTYFDTSISADTLRFGTDGTERMRIDHYGNVGIGTSSPSYKLDVSGTIRGSTAKMGTATDVNFFADATNVAVRPTVAGGGIYFQNYNGSSTYSVIDSSGNVGIGTSSPTSFGSGAVVTEIKGTTTYGALLASTNTVTGQLFANEGGLAVHLGSRTNHPLLLTTVNTERMRIDSSGNVGIGTSSPAALLNVYKSAGSMVIIESGDSYNATLKLKNSISEYSFTPHGAGTGALLFYDNTNGQSFYSYKKTVGHNWYINNSYAMILDSSGNVGIGTSSPTNKLSLTTSTFANGNVYVQDINYLTYPVLKFGYIGSGGSISAGLLDSAAYSMALATVGTERLRIDTNGYVGINTSSPSTILTVKTQTAAGFAALKVEDYSDTSGVYTASVAAGNFRFIAGDSYYYNGGAFRSNNTTSAVVNMYNGELKFYTNSGLTANTNFYPTERMRITSAGNVGIGTSSPNAQFHVSGGGSGSVLGYATNALITQNDSYSWGLAIQNATAGSNYAILQYVADDGTAFYQSGDGAGAYQTNLRYAPSLGGALDLFALSYIAFNTNGATERMRITSTGNVGIGASSPYGKLTIEGTGNLSSGISLRRTNAVNYRFGMFVGDGTGGYTSDENYISSLNTNLHFLAGSSGSTEIMTLLSSGNVGIGVSVPAQKLEVNGAVNLSTVSTPTAPASTVVTEYAGAFGGFNTLAARNALNTPFGLQTAFWQKSITMMNSASGATAPAWINAGGITSGGTQSNVQPTAGSTTYQSIKRVTFGNVVTTTNQVLGQGTTTAYFFRGSVAGQGGFFYFARIGFDTWTNGSRFFAGMATATTVISADPSALNNTVGFCVDAADNGAISFLTRGTAATKASTGLTIVSNKGYDCYIYCSPNSSQYTWQIVDINTGTSVTGTATANLPTNTTLQVPYALGSNAALTTANATVIGLNKIYIETDY